MRLPRTPRGKALLALTAGTLLLLVGMAAYAGSQSTTPPWAIAPSSQSPPEPSPAATISENTATPSSREPPAAIELITGPLTAWWGQRVALTIKTAPATSCRVKVVYKYGPSEAVGLEPQNSSGAGVVTWRWLVGVGTDPGRWPIFVTCGLAANQTYIDVK